MERKNKENWIRKYHSRKPNKDKGITFTNHTRYILYVRRTHSDWENVNFVIDDERVDEDYGVKLIEAEYYSDKSKLFGHLARLEPGDTLELKFNKTDDMK